MDPTMRPTTRHSRMDGSRPAHPVACRTRDPNLAPTHDCGLARLCARACCEVAGARDAAFPRHPYCLPHCARSTQCTALPDCEDCDCAVHRALRLCAVFADARKKWAAHALRTNSEVPRHLAESD